MQAAPRPRRSKLHESTIDADDHDDHEPVSRNHEEDEDEEDETRPQVTSYDPHPSATHNNVIPPPPPHEQIDEWQQDVKGISFAQEEECIMHDDRAEGVDVKLDQFPEGPYYVGYVVHVVSQNPVARLWVRRTFEGTVDRGFTYMGLKKTNGAYELVTTDPVLSVMMRSTPNAAEKLSAYLNQNLNVMIEQELAHPFTADVSKVSQTVKSFSAVRIMHEAFYEAGCFSDFLAPPHDSADRLFDAYLLTHEGNGKEVAVPMSFWNRAVRAYKASKNV